MEESYQIISNQLGKDQHSKVYKIKGNNSGIELIIKIYEDSRFIYYNNETNILNILNQNYNIKNNNNFFLMFKNIHFNHGLISIPKEIKGNNLEFLFYNFLPKLSLFDYITNINNNKIKEIHAKFLCYKLLKEIEKLQSIEISHNKLDISNIMFDDEFNLKIIHFSEANIIKDKYEKINDLFLLGQNLAKILSSKKFNSINYSKKYNQYVIYGNDKDKKLYMKESKFWKTLKALYNINISEKFINFFHILIEAKKSKKIVNINDLLNNEWINEIEKDYENIENKFKNDFKIFYEEIIKDNIENNKINIDINNILEESQKEPQEYFKYPESSFNEYCNYQSEEKFKENLNIFGKEDNNLMKSDYEDNSNKKNLEIEKKKNIKKYRMTESSEEEESIKEEKGKHEINIKEFIPQTISKKEDKKQKLSEEEGELSDEEEEEESIKEKKTIRKYKKIELSEESEISEIEKSVEKVKKMKLSEEEEEESSEVEEEESSEEEEEESSEEEKVKKKYRKKELSEEELNIKESKKGIGVKKKKFPSKFISEEDFEKKTISIKKEKKREKKKKTEIVKNREKLEKEKESLYEKEPLDIIEMNIKSKINKEKIEHGETFYKPRDEDFNYLEINIKNNDNRDVKRPLINFINKLKEAIKKEYYRIGIKINIKDDKDFSFIISYEFKITVFDDDEIEFLDDNLEKKVKNLQKYEIKVKLIEGDKNLYLINKINQYYLIFSGIETDKEDFYEHLIRLKNNSKKLLFKHR